MAISIPLVGRVPKGPIASSFHFIQERVYLVMLRSDSGLSASAFDDFGTAP